MANLHHRNGREDIAPAEGTVTVDIVYRGGFTPIWKFWGFDGWRLKRKRGMLTEEIPVKAQVSAPLPPSEPLSR